MGLSNLTQKVPSNVQIVTPRPADALNIALDIPEEHIPPDPDDADCEHLFS